MIQANELRIGNIAKIRSLKLVPNLFETVTVTAKNIVHVASGSLKLLPEQLTEEWLLRAGFKKHFASYTLSNFWPDIKFYSGNVFEVVYNDDFEIKQEIQYVHSLQNLYFALTGQELEFKEK